MKTSWAWPRADLLSGVRANATFVQPMSEREGHYHFGLDLSRRYRLTRQVRTDRIFSYWSRKKNSNSIGLLPSEQVVVLSARLRRSPKTTVAVR